jgi:hypothetical protein
MYMNLHTNYGDKAIQEECLFLGFHNITVVVYSSAMVCVATSQMNGDSIQEVVATAQRNILYGNVLTVHTFPPSDETTGDFIKRKEYSFEDISVTPEIQLQYNSSKDKEEVEENEKQEGFDRGTALEKYKLLQAERRSIVKKNTILLKKLAENFKQRKVKNMTCITNQF